MAYSSNINYQDEINKAVSSGDYALASRLEKERNEKIDGESLSYEKTYNYQKPEGITDATYNAMNQKYTPSEKQNQLDTNKANAGNKVTNLANKKDIVSTGTWSDINSEFKTPTAVKQADIYLAEQLEKIQSGKNSYSDQVRDMMDKIMNREKFSYDVDTDPLFQQALASAMGSGKQAMQDTIGQASALTGGYGSTYATSAGNQAYNAFIEDAYDNLPQYYQMAMEAYQMEGDEMYRQYGMLSAEDDKEYNRNVTAYDATYQYRNQLYNEAYGQHRDNVSDAFATANLEIAEHGQLMSDATNAYNVAADLADTEYERNYQSWLDSVNIAMQKGQIERGAYEYDKTFAENVRQYNESLAFNKQQHADQMSYNWASLNARGSSGGGSGGNDTFELDDGEVKEIKSLLASGATDDQIIDYLYNKGKMPDDMESFTGLLNTYRNQTTKEKITPVNIGTLNGFKTDKGYNFDIVVGGKSYGVENHGKVTNNKTLEKLKNYGVSNNNAFVHDGTIYVKKNNEYYKVGAYWTGGDNLAKALEALSKKSK